MPPPRVTFSDGEEITLTLSDFGAGLTLGQVGQLKLLDEVSFQFPSHWDPFQVQVATHIIDAQWRLNGSTYLSQSLYGGITYNLATGVSGQMGVDNELVTHLLERPLVSMDGVLTFRLNGEASQEGFNGDFAIGLGIRGRF
jgi:hypothetical protein